MGLLWILVTIPNYLEKREIEKFVDCLEIDEEYEYEYPTGLDPFDENKSEIIKILDIKKNKFGDFWVKYLYCGREKTMSIRSFKNHVKL
jgi:hypothetical protein